MENVNLTKEVGLQLYKEASETGKLILEKLFGNYLFNQKIEDRIQSFEDACLENGVEPEDILPYSEAQTPDEKSINAYAKLIQIIRAFNQGKVPDWKNSNQYKYYPWFWMDGRYTSSGSGLSFGAYDYDRSITYVASRLCLLEERHAEIVAKRFLDIYTEYMTQ